MWDKFYNAGKAATNVAGGGGLMSLLGGPVGAGLTALSMLPSIVGLFGGGEEEPQMGGGFRTQNPYIHGPKKPKYADQYRQPRGYQPRSAVDILSLMGRR